MDELEGTDTEQLPFLPRAFSNLTIRFVTPDGIIIPSNTLDNVWMEAGQDPLAPEEVADLMEFVRLEQDGSIVATDPEVIKAIMLIPDPRVGYWASRFSEAGRRVKGAVAGGDPDGRQRQPRIR